MTEEIFAQAQAMYRGRLDSREKSVLQELCRCAEEELRSRLREGVMPEGIGFVFATAAGTLALSMFIQLRRQAELLLRPWLLDDGFVFRGVPG